MLGQAIYVYKITLPRPTGNSKGDIYCIYIYIYGLDHYGSQSHQESCLFQLICENEIESNVDVLHAFSRLDFHGVGHADCCNSRLDE